MPSDTVSHFVFVDFENVPAVDLALVEGRPVHVTLLIGKHQKKLDVALFQQALRLADRFQLVEVGASGHNALDLTLAYYLGQSVVRDPGAQFAIVSKDKDFEPMISHLRDKGIAIVRSESFAGLPFLSPSKKIAAPLAKPSEDRRTKVIARLKNPATRNRPTTRNALLAHIKAALGKDATDAIADEIVRELIGENVLSIEPNHKVRYIS